MNEYKTITLVNAVLKDIEKSNYDNRLIMLLRDDLVKTIETSELKDELKKMFINKVYATTLEKIADNIVNMIAF